MMKKKATANTNGTQEHLLKTEPARSFIIGCLFFDPKPRDPLRIPRILNRVKEIWRQYPDFRFGQLFEVLTGPGIKDPWSMEDDAFEQLIETRYREVLAEQQVKRDMNAKSRPRRRNTN